MKNMPNDIGLHLHWIDNSNMESAVDELIGEVKYLLGERFDFTKEDMPNFRDARSYFANSRFLVVLKILSNKRGLIITDIDYQLIDDPKAFVVWCDEVGITLQVKGENTINSFFPWLKVLEGTVVVRNNHIGNTFLQLYAELFGKTYISQGFNWGLDQNILCNIYD